MYSVHTSKKISRLLFMMEILCMCFWTSTLAIDPQCVKCVNKKDPWFHYPVVALDSEVVVVREACLAVLLH